MSAECMVQISSERQPTVRTVACAVPFISSREIILLEMELRSKVSHFSIGPPRNLPTSQLPTNQDVVNYARLILSGKGKTRAKDLRNIVFKPVATKVIEMWTAEGIPVMLTSSVQRKVSDCYKKFQKMNKVEKSERDNNPLRIKEVEQFFGELFDIAVCKCRDLRRCNCPKKHRVPDAEKRFLKDQRGARGVFLGPVDHQESARRRRKAQRRIKRAANERSGTRPSRPATATVTSGGSPQHAADSDGPEVATSGNVESATAADPDWQPIDSAPGEANTGPLTNTALAADRFGISNRAVSAILNAYQCDIGRISGAPEDSIQIIDPKKVWRERNRVRQDEATNRDDSLRKGELSALYFDGRKDKTYVERSSDVAMEEHVAVVAEPGGEYATHFTPQSSKAIDQVNDLISIVCEYDGDIKVLGCDGASVNTGTAGGICRLYELIENKPVHWFVCQLHSNELNLREVFKHRDGKTTGPKSFQGQLGKEASGRVSDMPIVKFAPVPGSVPEIPEAVFRELSSDQQIVHSLAMGVQSGTITAQDAGRRIGPLNHAR